MVALLPPFGQALLLASEPAGNSVLSVTRLSSTRARWLLSATFDEAPGDVSGLTIGGISASASGSYGAAYYDVDYESPITVGQSWTCDPSAGFDGTFLNGLPLLPSTGTVV